MAIGTGEGGGEGMAGKLMCGGGPPADHWTDLHHTPLTETETGVRGRYGGGGMENRPSGELVSRSTEGCSV